MMSVIVKMFKEQILAGKIVILLIIKTNLYFVFSPIQ